MSSPRPGRSTSRSERKCRCCRSDCSAGTCSGGSPDSASCASTPQPALAAACRPVASSSSAPTADGSSRPASGSVPAWSTPKDAPRVSPTTAASTFPPWSGPPATGPTTPGSPSPGSRPTAVWCTGGGSPTYPGCTSSACPGSTPAGPHCSGSSPTTRPTSRSASPPGRKPIDKPWVMRARAAIRKEMKTDDLDWRASTALASLQLPLATAYRGRSDMQRGDSGFYISAPLQYRSDVAADVRWAAARRSGARLADVAIAGTVTTPTQLDGRLKPAATSSLSSCSCVRPGSLMAAEVRVVLLWQHSCHRSSPASSRPPRLAVLDDVLGEHVAPGDGGANDHHPEAVRRYLPSCGVKPIGGPQRPGDGGRPDRLPRHLEQQYRQHMQRVAEPKDRQDLTRREHAGLHSFHQGPGRVVAEQRDAELRWLSDRVRGVACPLAAFLFVGRESCGLEDVVEQFLRGDGVVPVGQGWPAVCDAVEEVVYGFGEAEGFGRCCPSIGLGAEVADGGDAVDGDRDRFWRLHFGGTPGAVGVELFVPGAGCAGRH